MNTYCTIDGLVRHHYLRDGSRAVAELRETFGQLRQLDGALRTPKPYRFRSWVRNDGALLFHSEALLRRFGRLSSYAAEEFEYAIRRVLDDHPEAEKLVLQIEHGASLVSFVAIEGSHGGLNLSLWLDALYQKHALMRKGAKAQEVSMAAAP